MSDVVDSLPISEDVSQEDRERLRRGLLKAEREVSRPQGIRILEKIVERRNAAVSSVAMAGLASAALWSGDMKGALHWAKLNMAQYPMTSSAVWSSALLVSLFRIMGMRRERFEAERERFRLMRKIVLHSNSNDDRIYALSELLKELESRELSEEAQRCAEELADLIRSHSRTHEALAARDISSTR